MKQKNRITLGFSDDEWQALKKWADDEYRTVPQLCLVIIKRSLDDRHASE
jgi:hypothetical protein